MSDNKVVYTGLVKGEQLFIGRVDPVVIRDAIELFFNEMVVECSGSDNGVDAVLDDYVINNKLRPFMEHYISKIE